MHCQGCFELPHHKPVLGDQMVNTTAVMQKNETSGTTLPLLLDSLMELNFASKLVAAEQFDSTQVLKQYVN